MPAETQYNYYDSALDRLFLSVLDQRVVALEYEPPEPQKFTTALPSGAIKHWLDQYFLGRPMPEDLTLMDQGTAFQQKVWRIMLQIPYGETLSYGAVSDLLGSAPRAVGQACKRNPVPLLIPCHRIVGKHSIGGYEGAVSGHKLTRKQWLLAHERAVHA